MHKLFWRYFQCLYIVYLCNPPPRPHVFELMDDPCCRMNHTICSYQFSALDDQTIPVYLIRCNYTHQKTLLSKYSQLPLQHIENNTVYFSVNLVQTFDRWAAMGANPQNPAWKAIQAVDGNENQDYNSNSCAITDVDNNHNTSIWWKVWLARQFNVAYLEIYFRSDSK